MVAVLMITYNHELFIDEAILGVMAQKTNFPFHLYISDDASTDGTQHKIEALVNKFPDKITYYRNEQNHGMMKNFVGLYSKVNADYIAMCEGDDYWTDPHKLQKQIDFLEANSDFMICFHKVLINKNGEMLDDFITKVPAEITTVEYLKKANYIHTPSVVFRNNVQLPDWYIKALPGDHILWLLLTDSGGKIKYMDDCMAVYRIHPNGVWSMQNPVQKFDQVIKTTYLRCALELQAANTWLEQKLIILRDSIMRDGYKQITEEEYTQLAKLAFKKLNYNWFRQLDFLTPRTMKLKRKIIHSIRHRLGLAKKKTRIVS